MKRMMKRQFRMRRKSIKRRLKSVLRDSRTESLIRLRMTSFTTKKRILQLNKMTYRSVYN